MPGSHGPPRAGSESRENLTESSVDQIFPCTQAQLWTWLFRRSRCETTGHLKGRAGRGGGSSGRLGFTKDCFPGKKGENGEGNGGEAKESLAWQSALLTPRGSLILETPRKRTGTSAALLSWELKDPSISALRKQEASHHPGQKINF